MPTNTENMRRRRGVRRALALGQDATAAAVEEALTKASPATRKLVAAVLQGTAAPPPASIRRRASVDRAPRPSRERQRRASIDRAPRAPPRGTGSRLTEGLWKTGLRAKKSAMRPRPELIPSRDEWAQACYRRAGYLAAAGGMWPERSYRPAAMPTRANGNMASAGYGNHSGRRAPRHPLRQRAGETPGELSVRGRPMAMGSRKSNAEARAEAGVGIHMAF
jgi:hypothetical protein